MDELFRDYYRHRDNSMLQLVFLLFSKPKHSTEAIVPDIENYSDGNMDIQQDNSAFK
jgi:hypothetical protein